jgi:hypothetical protein
MTVGVSKAKEAVLRQVKRCPWGVVLAPDWSEEVRNYAQQHYFSETGNGNLNCPPGCKAKGFCKGPMLT